ncbi:MAG: oligoendopeptidase F [Bacilli bacterium]|nr:oligoendopeptidase F [Bacilli bacterium]
MKKRSEVPEDAKWDLSSLYKNLEDFNKDFDYLTNNYKKYSEFEGKLNNAKDIYDFFIFDEEFSKKYEAVYNYSARKFDEDITDFKYQEISGKLDKLMTNISEVTSFVVPELMKLTEEDVNKFIKELPKLELYRWEFRNLLRVKPHVLSSEKEKLISLLSSPLSALEEIPSYLCDSDIKFGKITNGEGKEIELTNNNYSLYIADKNRDVRKKAFYTYYKQFSNMQNTFASAYSSYVKYNNINAKIRGYKDAREAALFGGNIDSKIYDNLIDTLHKNLSIMNDYYALKKEVLGLEETHIYDIYAPLISESDKKYTFDEAKDIIIKSLSILGKDYTNVLQKAFTDKWIDIYPNIGKRGGAYSAGCYTSNPFVLLNFNGKFHDVSTLAHELGHSMHTYYSIKNNPYIYHHYKIFVAEVASQVNEIILARYLIEHTDNKLEKLNILDSLMELFKGSIVRQTMFAEFEKITHESENSGKVLTSKFLSDTYYDLYKKYSGDVMISDPEIRYEWERIPHFYYNFYVYQYATGLASACYIASNILSGKKDALEKYLKFLTLGGTMDPVDELKVAGVDISDPEVIQSAMDMFKDTIKEFKELYKK